MEPGKILIAPGDFHMKVASSGGVHTRVSGSVAATKLLPSRGRRAVCFVGEVYGGAVLAVVLTGMGQDGLHGVEILKAARGQGSGTG